MCAIKQGCFKSLNRRCKKLNWDNTNIWNLKAIDDQPSLTDPGVADIPEEELYDKEDRQQKPSYITMALAAY